MHYFLSTLAKIATHNYQIMLVKGLLDKKVISRCDMKDIHILLDFSLTVKVATLIFISGCGSFFLSLYTATPPREDYVLFRGSAISSAKEGKSGSIYNLVNEK